MTKDLMSALDKAAKKAAMIAPDDMKRGCFHLELNAREVIALADARVKFQQLTADLRETVRLLELNTKTLTMANDFIEALKKDTPFQ